MQGNFYQIVNWNKPSRTDKVLDEKFSQKYIFQTGIFAKKCVKKKFIEWLLKAGVLSLITLLHKLTVWQLKKVRELTEYPITK